MCSGPTRCGPALAVAGAVAPTAGFFRLTVSRASRVRGFGRTSTRLYTYLNFRNPVDVVWGPGWLTSAVAAVHRAGQVRRHPLPI